MLSFKEKISLFNKYLHAKNDCYGDYMKDEIYFYFFENDNRLSFLEKLNSENEIMNKIEFLVSKMIMHEHEDGLHTIIENHI